MAIAPQSTGGGFTEDFIYRMEVSEPLPLINLERTPIASILSPANHDKFLDAMRRMYAHFSTLYRISGIFLLSVLFGPAQVGNWLSIPTLLCSIPALACSVAMYSSDILRILPRLYEFWFFTVLNLIHWVCLASFFSDFRMVSLVGGLIGTQSVIFIDANFRTVTSGIRSTIIAVPVLLVLGTATFFRLIDTDDRNYRVFPVAKVKVTLVDVFINASATLAVFIARKSYAKRQVLITQMAKIQTIRCVVFRTKLQLKKPPARTTESRSLRVETRVFVLQPAVDGISAQVQRTISSFAPLPLSCIEEQSERVHFEDEMTQNRLAEETDPSLTTASFVVEAAEKNQQVSLVSMQLSAIDVRDVVVRCCSPVYVRISIIKAIVIYTNGVVGLVTTVWTLSHRPPGSQNPPTTTEYTIANTALVTTLVFFLTCAASFHRDLAKTLLHNFDFLFSSVQFTLAMILISDMVQWDFRTLGAMAWLLWFHSVLFLDALTPHIKYKLRFRKIFFLPVITASLVGIIFIIYGFFFSDVTQYFRDRTLWEMEFRGKWIGFRTKSLLMNRLFTVLLWSFRLIWETAGCPEDELIFIRGSLDYYTSKEMFPPPKRLKMVVPAALVTASLHIDKIRRSISPHRRAVLVLDTRDSQSSSPAT